MVVAIGLSGSSWAEKLSGHIDTLPSNIGYLAYGQWLSGKVEKIETDGKYQYIRINGIQYRTMPKVTIDRRVPRSTGAYDEVPASFQDIREKMDIMLKVQGFRIYQILITE